MYIFIENGMIHNSELVPLIFELSLRLHPLPVRSPHSDCASRDTIKHGKGGGRTSPVRSATSTRPVKRTFCNRAETPYYWKHYPSQIILTCLDHF
jgi:hypothetical protein